MKGCLVPKFIICTVDDKRKRQCNVQPKHGAGGAKAMQRPSSKGVPFSGQLLWLMSSGKPHQGTSPFRQNPVGLNPPATRSKVNLLRRSGCRNQSMPDLLDGSYACENCDKTYRRRCHLVRHQAVRRCFIPHKKIADC